MTLKRFIARRGTPAEIFCYHSRNFIAVRRYLKHNTEKVSDFATKNSAKFIFTPAYAPRFSG